MPGEKRREEEKGGEETRREERRRRGSTKKDVVSFKSLTRHFYNGYHVGHKDADFSLCIRENRWAGITRVL